jgi:Xaa-Pro aminopeptidase
VNDALGRVMGAERWDAILLSSPENVLFASGAHVHTQSLIRRRQAMVVLGPAGDGALIVAEVERGLAARHNRLSQLLAYREFEQTAIDLALPILGGMVKPGGAVGLEMEHLPAGDYERLRATAGEAFGSVRFAAVDEHLRRLRAVKSTDETETYARGARALDRAICAAAAACRAGTREEQLAAAIVSNLYGITGAEVRTAVGLVASGRNLLTTHHVADGTPIEPGAVARVGCRATLGACHILVARTAVAAPSRPGIADLYARLMSAREDLVASLRPGATGDEVFRRAARFRASVGLELRTAHVGHGIGLEYQEPPRLRPGSTDALAAGMVLLLVTVASVEGIGNLYSEDIAAVGASGATLLSDYAPRTPLVIE